MPHWPLPGWPDRALHTYTLTELQLALVDAPEMIKPDLRHAIEAKREENRRVDLAGDRTARRAREKAILRDGSKPAPNGTRQKVKRALPVVGIAAAVAGYRELASIGLVAARIPDNPVLVNCLIALLAVGLLLWALFSTVMGGNRE